MARLLYRIAIWATARRIDWLAALIYRVVCPYPINGRWTASACWRSGDCGCDNRKRR